MAGPKKQDFRPKINILKGNHYILRIQGAPVHQKLGVILENKVVQKFKFKKRFVLQKMVSQIDILKWFFFENLLWKYNFGTFWQTIIHRGIVLKKFSLSMLIFRQKSCILGSTIFKIPQPNWHYYLCRRSLRYVVFYIKTPCRLEWTRMWGITKVS